MSFLFQSSNVEKSIDQNWDKDRPLPPLSRDKERDSKEGCRNPSPSLRDQPSRQSEEIRERQRESQRESQQQRDSPGGCSALSRGQHSPELGSASTGGAAAAVSPTLPPMIMSPTSGLQHMQQILQQHVLTPQQLQNLMKQHTMYLQHSQHQHQVSANSFNHALFVSHR